MWLLILMSQVASPEPTFDVKDAERFARLALECVHREYPNKIAHVMNRDGDARPPSELTPVFFGCYDWHSAVHGHWLLVRLLETFPDAAFAIEARSALAKSFTPEKIAAEVAYLNGEGRGTFERPYGLAWLLQLASELRRWKDPDGERWANALVPLEGEVAARFADWFPKLTFPIRTGEHSQTAFAMGLVLDWARVRGEESLERLLVRRARDYYERDELYPLRFEPGGQDFLSPAWAEADLMRRVLTPSEYSSWLRRFLPELDRLASTEFSGTIHPGLTPAMVSDRSDGKLAHLDGLNLSRAWMMEGVLEALSNDDPRRTLLADIARAHREAGLAAVTGEFYEGGHWLGSFAVYLVSRAGK
ncbi:MAG: DUF2891 domain-containing protein [Myxococcota bacterium]